MNFRCSLWWLSRAAGRVILLRFKLILLLSWFVVFYFYNPTDCRLTGNRKRLKLFLPKRVLELETGRRRRRRRLQRRIRTIAQVRLLQQTVQQLLPARELQFSFIARRPDAAADYSWYSETRTMHVTWLARTDRRSDVLLTDDTPSRRFCRVCRWNIPQQPASHLRVNDTIHIVT